MDRKICGVAVDLENVLTSLYSLSNVTVTVSYSEITLQLIFCKQSI
jgi:hypothetical protein